MSGPTDERDGERLTPIGDLDGSDLDGSDLDGSDLDGSDLDGSDLDGSDLDGSGLDGSDLDGSDLDGSDLDLDGVVALLRGATPDAETLAVAREATLARAAAAPTAATGLPWSTVVVTGLVLLAALAGPGGEVAPSTAPSTVARSQEAVGTPAETNRREVPVRGGRPARGGEPDPGERGDARPAVPRSAAEEGSDASEASIRELPRPDARRSARAGGAVTDAAGGPEIAHDEGAEPSRVARRARDAGGGRRGGPRPTTSTPASTPAPPPTPSASSAPASSAPASSASASIASASIASVSIASDPAAERRPAEPPRAELAIAPAGPIAARAGASRERLAALVARDPARAVTALQPVVDGATDDPPAAVAEAELMLAKALYGLGLYHASGDAFARIAERPTHPYFEPSLTWLAMLAARLPDPWIALEGIERYDDAQRARLAGEGDRVDLPALRLQLGRHRYQAGALEAAIGALAGVPDRAASGLEARLLEGAAYVRLRRAEPAERAFRRALAATEGPHPSPEAARLRTLAWLSLARLAYTRAMRDPVSPRSAARLREAMDAWGHVPVASPRFAEAFLEESWALYVAGQPARALGHLHALEAPRLRARADPEALVLRAIIQLEHCQWAAAERAVIELHARYGPVLEGGEVALRHARTNEDAFRLLAAVRAGRSRAPRAVRPRLRDALGDRELTRRLEGARAIAEERRRLAGLSLEAPLEAGIAARLDGRLGTLEAGAIDRVGERTRAQLRAMVDDLRERISRMDTVEIELSTATRRALGRPPGPPMGPPEGGPIVAVQGGQRWPFEGEFWPDELPHYEQRIESRCGP